MKPQYIVSLGVVVFAEPWCVQIFLFIFLSLCIFGFAVGGPECRSMCPQSDDVNFYCNKEILTRERGGGGGALHVMNLTANVFTIWNLSIWFLFVIKWWSYRINFVSSFDLNKRAVLSAQLAPIVTCVLSAYARWGAFIKINTYAPCVSFWLDTILRSK